MSEISLNYTGERMIPEQSDMQTFWEHIYRYRFALPYVKGKRVLDIACGEGYGTSALLMGGAKKVIGVDISREACDFAKAKYKVDARVGSAEEIPLSDNSVDVIISFETIEHLEHPVKFLQESLRVLSNNGVLLISTPNKALFDNRGDNHFHINEMSKSEFVLTISKYYSNLRLFGQIPIVKDILARNSLCSQKIPSNRIRGSWRLNRLRSSILRRSYEKGFEKARLKANRVILEKDGIISQLFNPYIVRPVYTEQEEYIFYIAIARKSFNN